MIEATAGVTTETEKPAELVVTTPPEKSGTADKTVDPAIIAADGGAEKPTVEDVIDKVEPDWPEDWRARFVKKAKPEDRDKLSKRLARFVSPDNLLASYFDLERKVSTGALKNTLPAEPSPEDIATFRKAWGVPEAPEGYGIAFPAEMQVSESDKADLSAFVKAMHDAHTPPSTVKATFDYYLGMRQQAMEQIAEAAYQRTIEAKSELKAEMGREYPRNLRLAMNHVSEKLGDPDKAQSLVELPLADGTKLGDNPDFIRLLVKAALDTATDEMLVTSDISANGKSLDEQYNEALELKFTNPEKYNGEAHQAFLMRLAAAKASRATRAA